MISVTSEANQTDLYLSMYRQEHRVWISKPSLRDPSLSELEASLLAMEQQNKEMASLKHDLVSPTTLCFVIFSHPVPVAGFEPLT